MPITPDEAKTLANAAGRGSPRDTAKFLRAVTEGDFVAAGTKQTAVPDYTITYGAADPSITPGDSIEFANGGTPTVSELLEAVEDLSAKLNAALAVMRAYGMI